MRTFPHCARVSRSVPCANSLSGATGGRPVFLRSFMPVLSVPQERIANAALLCHNNTMQTVVKTLKIRVKDKHASVRRRMARDVNQVFNFANETSSRAIRERGKWLSTYDLQKLTAGFSKCDGVTVGSGTVQLVCVCGVRDTPQAVQEGPPQLARQQPEVTKVFARLDSIQGRAR